MLSWYFYFLYFDTHPLILTKDFLCSSTNLNKYSKPSQSLLAKPKVRRWGANSYCLFVQIQMSHFAVNHVNIPSAHFLWLLSLASSQVSIPHRSCLGLLLSFLLGTLSCDRSILFEAEDGILNLCNFLDVVDIKRSKHALHTE